MKSWKIYILPIRNAINYLNDLRPGFWFELWHFNVDKRPLLKIIQSFSSAIFSLSPLFLVAYLRGEQTVLCVFYAFNSSFIDVAVRNSELKQKQQKRMKLQCERRLQK